MRSSSFAPYENLSRKLLPVNDDTGITPSAEKRLSTQIVPINGIPARLTPQTRELEYEATKPLKELSQGINFNGFVTDPNAGQKEESA